MDLPRNKKEYSEDLIMNIMDQFENKRARSWACMYFS